MPPTVVCQQSHYSNFISSSWFTTNVRAQTRWFNPMGCNPALPDGSYQETDKTHHMIPVRWAQGLPWGLKDKELTAHF
jgi:hypothetical protein